MRRSIVTEHQQELPVGLLVDRFGSEHGMFLAPAGSPYSRRSLPPPNLGAPGTESTHPYNYHVYRVRSLSDPFQ